MQVGLIKQFERYCQNRDIPEIYRILTDPKLSKLTHPDLDSKGAYVTSSLLERLYIGTGPPFLTLPSNGVYPRDSTQINGTCTSTKSL